jgi:carbonic anhydrase
VFCLVAVSGLVDAGIEAGGDYLSKLLEGNRRFISGEIAQKDIGDKRRQELTKGQHPFATVLSRSDSRVDP